jgi:hypothetical protein
MLEIESSLKSEAAIAASDECDFLCHA